MLVIVNEAAREFGDALRRERERRGITLDQVAEATKISATIMSGLERGDLSRWPNGLFRRAFVRAYCEAVGLRSEQVVQAFVEVHGDDGQGPTSRAAVEPRRIEQACSGELQSLRLRLAGEPERPLASLLSRGGPVAIDLAVPCLAGGGVAFVLGLPMMAGIGAAALCSLVVSSVWARRTLGHEVMRRTARSRREPVTETPASQVVDAPEPLLPAPADTDPRRVMESVRASARSRRSSRERARIQRANRHA